MHEEFFVGERMKSRLAPAPWVFAWFLKLEREGFQPFAEGWAEVVALEGELYCGFEEA